MRTSTSGGLYMDWTEPSYEIRVRGTMHLWGSAGITKDISFAGPLLLHVHNDLFGAEITLGVQKAGTEESLGTLQAGEFVSIPLQDVSGVVASCEHESTVCCLVKS